MQQTEFENLFKKIAAQAEHLLVVKGGEYAGSADRLANFKRGAALVGVDPLTVLAIYLSKHYDAVMSYVRASEAGTKLTLSEPIEGRFLDLINYCILAIALIEEARKNEVTSNPAPKFEYSNPTN